MIERVHAHKLFKAHSTESLSTFRYPLWYTLNLPRYACLQYTLLVEKDSNTNVSLPTGIGPNMLLARIAISQATAIYITSRK